MCFLTKPGLTFWLLAGVLEPGGVSIHLGLLCFSLKHSITHTDTWTQRHTLLHTHTPSQIHTLACIHQTNTETTQNDAVSHLHEHTLKHSQTHTFTHSPTPTSTQTHIHTHPRLEMSHACAHTITHTAPAWRRTPPPPSFLLFEARLEVSHLPGDSILTLRSIKILLAPSFIGCCPASAVSLRKLKLLKVSEREGKKEKKFWHLFPLEFLVSLMKHGSLLLQRSSCFARRRECPGCLGSLPAACSQRGPRHPVWGRAGTGERFEGGAGTRVPLPPASASSLHARWPRSLPWANSVLCWSLVPS